MFIEITGIVSSVILVFTIGFIFPRFTTQSFIAPLLFVGKVSRLLKVLLLLLIAAL